MNPLTEAHLQMQRLELRLATVEAALRELYEEAAFGFNEHDIDEDTSYAQVVTIRGRTLAAARAALGSEAARPEEKT